MQKFILSTLIEDKDWDPLYVINWKCFKDDPTFGALMPGGLDPACRAANVERFKNSAFGGAIERAYAKITETTTGDITSFITCRVYRGLRGIIDGDLGKPQPPVKMPIIEDEKEREWFEALFTYMRDEMRANEYMQAPHVYIQGLATDPAWQRHGAASMLLDWILDFAAREHIGRLALQTTPELAKAGFYQKFGFRVTGDITFADKERWPEKASVTTVTLVKDNDWVARGGQGSSLEV